MLRGGPQVTQAKAEGEAGPAQGGPLGRCHSSSEDSGPGWPHRGGTRVLLWLSTGRKGDPAVPFTHTGWFLVLIWVQAAGRPGVRPRGEETVAGRETGQ